LPYAFGICCGTKSVSLIYPFYKMAKKQNMIWKTGNFKKYFKPFDKFCVFILEFKQ